MVAVDVPPANAASDDAAPGDIAPGDIASLGASPGDASLDDTESRDSNIEARLTHLEQIGARVFDPVGYQFALTLARRADEENAVASAHLRTRAHARMDLLDANYEDSRREATEALEELSQVDPAAAHALGQDLAAGHARGLVKRAKALTVARSGAARGQAVTRLMRLEEEARRRCPSVPPALEERSRAVYSESETVDALKVHEVANWYSLLLFRETTASARLGDTLADFDREIAEEAGPYNAQAIAAATVTQLAEMSPSYVRMLLAHISDLAEGKRLLGLNAPPPKKKRGRR